MERWWLAGRITALLVVAGLLAAACDGPAAPPAAGSGSESIVIGATISITGQMAEEGRYTRDGYQFAVETINRAGGIRIGDQHYPVTLKYYDDQSDPQRVAPLYEKLITQDKVNFLLGPYTSALTAAAVPVAEKYQIPLVDAHGSAESIFAAGNRFTFGILSPARNYLRGVIAVVAGRQPRPRTVALLGADEAFSHEVLAGAADYAASKGLQVVYQGYYPVAPRDVSALLRQVKQQQPDIVLSAGHLQDSLLVARQAKDVSLAPKALGFTAGPSAPEFRANLKADADYIFGATQWTAALQYHGDDPWQTPRAYAQAFQAAHPDYQEVPYQTAESSAALIVYQRALEKAGSLDLAGVRNALANLDLLTFYGRIKFDERGVNIYKPMAVEQLQPDGKKYTVFPSDVAEKDALYPMPPWMAR